MSFDIASKMKIGSVVAGKFEIVAVPEPERNVNSFKLKILEPFINEPRNWLDQSSRQEVGLITQAMRATQAEWAGVIGGDEEHIHIGFDNSRSQSFDHK